MMVKHHPIVDTRVNTKFIPDIMRKSEEGALWISNEAM